jgi:selenocysteine lyase/cysteine desulfurase
MEKHFSKFRNKIIGIDAEFANPYGEKKKVIYADWVASGRMYESIEYKMLNNFYPYVGNTHTETNITGKGMTIAYHQAKEIIKKHVNASENDIMLSAGFGMTGAVNKLQRILGYKIHEKYKSRIDIPEDERPIVFITHMEHHSNQVSWLETIAELIIVDADENGLVSVENFKKNDF